MFYKILVIIISFQSISLCKESCTSDNNSMKLIIDTDAGGDDAVAIFLLLANKNIQIIAITCVYGNTEEKNVENNVLKILTIANRTDIPVYGGSAKPLLKNYSRDNFFGNDGFGDFQFDKNITATIDRSKHASIAIIELSKAYSDDINILTLGALTNIALAASLDSNFTQRINKFYVMGSIIDESMQSKINPNIEFNFGLDPDSNAIFFNSTVNRKILILPWDVVLKEAIAKKWRTDILGNVNSQVIQYLNKIEAVALKKTKAWFTSDTIIASILLWPDLVTTFLEAKLSAVNCGPFKGSVLVESINVESRQKNVEIVRNFKTTIFKKKLLQCLS
ncbi:PREDICTED: probable uridine nucleosidase 2 [Ceratosolen solmsi marchali]|uniref:Probable uridine nucleosidase 2 n=1 Tax=Ceratosolen solmsi marchali TaxID=326594 RepID=A0AAJ6YVA5_9HYME|nr:PREDICTED: probable uridine nucleosidase 2 [Ceratosolen solmsi marchali]